MIKNSLKKRYFKRIYRDQNGITGLETAIILIAFVVVAAVFAYTVLSAGLFSTQKGQEAVYSGLEEAQSSMEIKGGVIADGVAQLDNCDVSADWTANAHYTVTDDSSAGDYVEGTASMSIVDAGTAVQNDTVRHDMTAKSFAAGETITFWAKVSDNGMSGDYAFVIDDSANLQSPTETVAITATTSWTKNTLTITAASPDDVAVYYGIIATDAAPTDGTLWIDNVVISNANLASNDDPMTTYAGQVILTVTNALGGEPIDFTITSDADNDGIISDEATKTHKIMVAYNDEYQQINELAWTKSSIGYDDGDNLLEENEKFQITVDLTYVNGATTKVDARHPFALDIKPNNGAVLVVERTMPSTVQNINNLN